MPERAQGMRRLGRSTFAALAALCALAASCSVPGPSAASTETPPALRPVPGPGEALAGARAAQARGLAWLLANQRHDGSFGSFESPRAREVFLDTQASHRAFHSATTALACWALVAPARTDPAARAALDRGLAWLLAQGEVGRASGNTFYGVWAHTYLLELGAAVVAEPSLAGHHAAWREALSREAQLARRDQSADGGWAYYDFDHVGETPSGHESTSFNTAAMVEALLHAREQGSAVPEGALADAVKCIERLRIPNGSYAYGTYAELAVGADYNRISGASCRLQACNVALARMNAGGVDGAALLSGAALLRERHHYVEIARGRVMPHEAYYRNSGYYYFFGHYYAARALELATPGAARDELARWLAAQMSIDQNPDGSWFDYPLYGYGFAYATGYAMRTLQVLEPILARPPEGGGAGDAAKGEPGPRR